MPSSPLHPKPATLTPFFMTLTRQELYITATLLCDLITFSFPNMQGHVASLRDAKGDRSEFKILALLIPINKFRGLYPFCFR